jgi:gamma-glutamyl-gamma-aminobutyrate hydrolase PuuD
MITSSMKKIGLTQRVTRVENYNERRDSLDQRWWPLINALGLVPIPLANLPAKDAADYAQSLDLSAIIITGGNSLQVDELECAPERDAFENALLAWALQTDRPVVGVCHGMQMINQYFGGSLTKLNNHVATRHIINFCGGWQQFNDREVNSYHDWGIITQNLGKDLKASAQHADDTVEAFLHIHKKVAGIMWHPEREAPYDADDIYLLKNLLGVS